jgi:hypothetical protein
LHCSNDLPRNNANRINMMQRCYGDAGLGQFGKDGIRFQADLSIAPVSFPAISADFVDMLKFGNLLLSDVV